MTAATRPGSAFFTWRPSTPEHNALRLALVQLAAAGRRPRCGEPATHTLWTSDQPSERLQAARWCDGCPVRAPCAEAGESETAGVWGGVDRTRQHRHEAEAELP